MKLTTIVVVIVIIVVLGGLAYTLRPTSPTMSQPTATMPLATVSSVPSTTSTPPSAKAVPAGWQTQTDTANHLSFSYPPNLGTKYIQTVDWPPKLQVVNKAYSCTEAGSPIARAGQTMVQKINNRDYCVTEVAEGAAGSIYRQYAYATARGQQTAILTFTLRFPQCANYPDPQKTECTQESQSFATSLNQIIDQIIDQIFQTFLVTL